jgi:hypothetical protein
MIGIIEDKQIRGFSGELCHKRTRPCFRGQIDANDPVMLNLGDGINVCTLKMGTQELAERRRRWRVLDRCGSQVQTSGFWKTRDQQTMGLPRCSNLQHDCERSRLMDFLNPASREYRGDFSKDGCDILAG